MSAPTATTTAWQRSTDVLTFAAQHQFQADLDALLTATQQLYPTATSLRVFLEDDPEIRDMRYIVLEVHVPTADVPDYVAVTRPWYRELSRICPASRVYPFVLTLLRS